MYKIFLIFYSYKEIAAINYASGKISCSFQCMQAIMQCVILHGSLFCYRRKLHLENVYIIAPCVYFDSSVEAPANKLERLHPAGLFRPYRSYA
jgi:hypothetical protein